MRIPLSDRLLDFADMTLSACEAMPLFKTQTCLKELRESQQWIRLARRRGYKHASYDAIEQEVGELVAMFVACVTKVKSRLDSEKRLLDATSAPD